MSRASYSNEVIAQALTAALSRAIDVQRIDDLKDFRQQQEALTGLAAIKAGVSKGNIVVTVPQAVDTWFEAYLEDTCRITIVSSHQDRVRTITFQPETAERIVTKLAPYELRQVAQYSPHANTDSGHQTSHSSDDNQGHGRVSPAHAQKTQTDDLESLRLAYHAILLGHKRLQKYLNDAVTMTIRSGMAGQKGCYLVFANLSERGKAHLLKFPAQMVPQAQAITTEPFSIYVENETMLRGAVSQSNTRKKRATVIRQHDAQKPDEGVIVSSSDESPRDPAAGNASSSIFGHTPKPAELAPVRRKARGASSPHAESKEAPSAAELQEKKGKLWEALYRCEELKPNLKADSGSKVVFATDIKANAQEGGYDFIFYGLSRAGISCLRDMFPGHHKSNASEGTFTLDNVGVDLVKTIVAASNATSEAVVSIDGELSDASSVGTNSVQSLRLGGVQAAARTNTRKTWKSELSKLQSTLADLVTEFNDPRWDNQGRAGLFSWKVPQHIREVREFLNSKEGRNANAAGMTDEQLGPVAQGLKEILDSASTNRSVGSHMFRQGCVSALYSKWQKELNSLLPTTACKAKSY